MKKNQGFSLIEILVVILIFALLGVIASQSILRLVGSVKKTDAESKVRSSLEYSLAVIERQLHNAKSVSTCNGVSETTLTYTDYEDREAGFYCFPGINGYVASASAGLSESYPLTSGDVAVISCSFICNQPDLSLPPEIDIFITGEAKDLEGKERSRIQVSTKIFLRAY